MMKKIWIVLLAVMAFSLGIANAEEVSVGYVDGTQDVMFYVSWTNSEPSVVLIAPDGTRYDPAQDMPETEVVKNEKNLFYIVKNIQTGYWNAEVDAKDNGEGEYVIEWYPAEESNLQVASLEQLGFAEDTKLQVRFSVTGADQGCGYELFLIAENGTMSDVVESGYVQGSEEQTVSMDLSRFGSGTYSVYLNVYTRGEVETYATRILEGVVYQNPYAPQAPEGYLTSLYPLKQMVSVSWEDYPYEIKNVLAGVFADDGAEPIASYEGNRDADYMTALYGPDVKELGVEVSVKNDYVYSEAAKTKIALASLPKLTVDEVMTVNSHQVWLPYQGFSGEDITITVGSGEAALVQTSKITGDGRILLNLSEGTNPVCISFYAQNTVQVVYEMTIVSNTTAPIIYLDRSYDGTTTAESKLVISGVVHGASSCTIDGQPVELSDDGSFVSRIALKQGENVITLQAVNEVGNASQMTITIQCESKDAELPVEKAETKAGGFKDKLPSWLADNLGYFTGGLAGAALVLICVLGKGKKKQGGKDEE